MKHILHLSLAGLWMQCCLTADVIQIPKFRLSHPGSNVTLRCEHSDTNYLNKCWYRLVKGQELKLIGCSYNVDKPVMEREFENKVTIFPESAQKSTVYIKGVSIEDSGVYYCASSPDSYRAPLSGNKLEFGQGTVLSVIEKGREKKNPNVTIFLPNPQELEQHNRISLVCVASNFYPQQAYIRWKVNGKEREFIDQAKPITVSDTFSVSRRLSLTREEYYNPENIFRCESGFQDVENKVIYKQISGKKGCSSLTDTYRRYTNSGKYSYILILCKSALYGLIVAAVMLRKKMIRSSY